MADTQVLEPLSQALGRFPEGATPSHVTAWRWGRKYPSLVRVIGGRMFAVPKCWDAIARGTPLAEAARLGSDDDGRAAA
jgi:hypothetical protein